MLINKFKNVNLIYIFTVIVKFFFRKDFWKKMRKTHRNECELKIKKKIAFKWPRYTLVL